MDIKELIFAIGTMLEPWIGNISCTRKIKQVSAEGPFCKAVSGRMNRPAKLILLLYWVCGGCITYQLWM